MSRLLLLVTEGMGCALSSATLLLVAHGAAPDCPLLWAPLQGDGASPGNREASAWSRLSRPTGWAGLGALCCPPAWTFTSPTSPLPSALTERPHLQVLGLLWKGERLPFHGSGSLGHLSALSSQGPDLLWATLASWKSV